MRIFIAGPTLGREDTYKAVFAAAADTLRKGGHEPVNPVAIELGENADRADYITAALDALWSADAIYLLPGWRDSDLAQVQARVAELRGMRRFGVTA